MGIAYTIDVSKLWEDDPDNKPSDTRIFRAGSVSARKGVQVAKENARVDTGAMRDSIDWSMDDNYQLTISCSVDYDKYNEFGTERMDAQPFMEPGLNTVLEELNQRLGYNTNEVDEQID